MPTIQVNAIINAPQKLVFNISQDYYKRYEWDPFLDDIKVITNDPLTVWVKSKVGMSMTVEYITLASPKTAAVRMVKGPWIFTRFSGSWRFGFLGERQCSVSFMYNFSSRIKILNRAIVLILQYQMKNRIAALKYYCEYNLLSDGGN